MKRYSPYYSNEPTLISFSGGRTSGYMLHKVVEAHRGELPDFVKVCFANTGKELPETLDFVRDCAENFGVKINWLEYGGRTPKDENPERYNYYFNVVDYETASRKGEPFERLIRDTGMLPNPLNRMCSGQLKVRTINRYLDSIGFPRPRLAFVGLRADEPHRAMKLHNQRKEGQEIYCPLYEDGVTKQVVGDFWKAQKFDLGLPNNNGVTDLGNCDLCFLKGKHKRISIMRQKPELAIWWVEMEEKFSDQFERSGDSYINLINIAGETDDLFAGQEFESLPCFCGD